MHRAIAPRPSSFRPGPEDLDRQPARRRRHLERGARVRQVASLRKVSLDRRARGRSGPCAAAGRARAGGEQGHGNPGGNGCFRARKVALLDSRRDQIGRPARRPLSTRHAASRLLLADTGGRRGAAADPLRQRLGPPGRSLADRLRRVRACRRRLVPAVHGGGRRLRLRRRADAGARDRGRPEPPRPRLRRGAALRAARLRTQGRLRGDQPPRREGQPGAAPLRELRLRAGARGRRRGRDAGRTLSRQPVSRILQMECDVAVLGGGPGGYTAAIRAAQLGAKAVCIEKEPELGGTCLRVGCIPTKAWVQTAFAIKEAEETFAKLGVQVGAPTLDLPTANEWKNGVVKQMTSGVASLFKANGVEWVPGTGRFKDANTIAVEGGEDVTFKQAIIATGSYPLRPPIDGLDSPRCVDSTGLLAQTQVPGRLVVLGGGIIGCEFASIFRRFGSEGPIVENLGLEEIGVEFDKRKGIAADEHRRTTQQHIYAVGDCAGYWQLAHTAFREGEVAAENAMGHDAVVDNRGVPRPIYTDPEIAGVGLTEAEAREQYGDDVEAGVFPWVANARAVLQNATVGWVKSIHETRYGELLGVVMVGPHVTDLVEAGVVAIDAEATVETVADGIAPHPTLSEAIKEAGLVALGRAIHLPPKRRVPAKA